MNPLFPRGLLGALQPIGVEHDLQVMLDRETLHVSQVARLSGSPPLAILVASGCVVWVNAGQGINQMIDSFHHFPRLISLRLRSVREKMADEKGMRFLVEMYMV